MRTHHHTVVAYDFSLSSMAALERGIDVAARTAHDVLHFVCVIEPHTAIPAIPTDGKIDAAYATQVQEALFTEVELQLALAETDVHIDFFVHARIGKPADEVLELAHEVGADLIIVGSKGLRGLERFIVGSVSEKIVRAAGCTVEVARPKAYRERANVRCFQLIERLCLANGAADILAIGEEHDRSGRWVPRVSRA